MKTGKNANERKSIREVVNENKDKIIIGSGLIVGITFGVIISRTHKNLAKDLTKINEGFEFGGLIDSDLMEKITITENIITNSGIIDQARATVTRKRDTLISKLNCLSNMDQINDDIINKITEIKAGINGFDKMLDQYDELEYLYKCRTIGENVL